MERTEWYSAYHDLRAWTTYMEAAGFESSGTTVNRTPSEHQPWLASTWRKPE